MLDNEVIFRFENEIRLTIKNEGLSKNKLEGKRGNVNRFEFAAVHQENYPVSNLVGALSIVYSAGSFLAVDRILKMKGNFRKQRRIIFYLDSRPGQIGSTLFLQLLQIKNGEEFSKHKFIQRIDQEFFQSEGINVSSGEINEVLSRMFRKTMVNYFGEDGRTFIRQPFSIRIQELSRSNTNLIGYSYYKTEIDYQANSYISELNRMI